MVDLRARACARRHLLSLKARSRKQRPRIRQRRGRSKPMDLGFMNPLPLDLGCGCRSRAGVVRRGGGDDKRSEYHETPPQGMQGMPSIENGSDQDQIWFLGSDNLFASQTGVLSGWPPITYHLMILTNPPFTTLDPRPFGTPRPS